MFVFDEAQKLIDDYEKSHPPSLIMYSEWGWLNEARTISIYSLDFSSSSGNALGGSYSPCSYFVRAVVWSNEVSLSCSQIWSDYRIHPSCEHVFLRRWRATSIRSTSQSSQTARQERPIWIILDWTERWIAGKLFLFRLCLSWREIYSVVLFSAIQSSWSISSSFDWDLCQMGAVISWNQGTRAWIRSEFDNAATQRRWKHRIGSLRSQRKASHRLSSNPTSKAKIDSNHQESSCVYRLP